MAGLTKGQFDVANLILKINQVGEKALRGGKQILEEEGEKLADLARSFAPVDEGDLERAIEVNKSAEKDSRNRFQLEVWVNPDAPGSGGAVHAADYALTMHEFQTPAGPIPLGEKSQAKDGGRGVVGGKFMERAYIARRSVIGKRLAELMRKLKL